MVLASVLVDLTFCLVREDLQKLVKHGLARPVLSEFLAHCIARLLMIQDCLYRQCLEERYQPHCSRVSSWFCRDRSLCAFDRKSSH